MSSSNPTDKRDMEKHTRNLTMSRAWRREENNNAQTSTKIPQLISYSLSDSDGSYPYSTKDRVNGVDNLALAWVTPKHESVLWMKSGWHERTVSNRIRLILNEIVRQEGAENSWRPTHSLGWVTFPKCAPGTWWSLTLGTPAFRRVCPNSWALWRE